MFGYGGGLGEAISNLLNKIQVRDEAKGSCDHSWGHFGYELDIAVEEAEKNVIDKIEIIVEAKFNEIASKKEYPHG